MPLAYYQHLARATAGRWISWTTLLLAATCFPAHAIAESLCESCEVQLGVGGTYHFWGGTGGVVVPLTVQWRDGRYELGVFRVTTQQVLYDNNYPRGRLMAKPYWASSISRRWQLTEAGPVRLFFGFGVMAKTESDQLSSTRLDFASQLGLRFRFPGNQVVGELTMRHWSNAGIRLPNHGQDFATLTFRLNTAQFGAEGGERMAASTLSEMRRARAHADDATDGLP